MSERDTKYAAFVKQDKENNLGRLVNACNELKYLLDNPIANKVFAEHYQNEILTYATSFSPFYKQYEGFKSLQDFPILTKADLKLHWGEIAVNQCFTWGGAALNIPRDLPALHSK